MRNTDYRQELRRPRAERAELAGFAGDDDMAGGLPKIAWARNGREQQSTCPGAEMHTTYSRIALFLFDMILMELIDYLHRQNSTYEHQHRGLSYSNPFTRVMLNHISLASIDHFPQRFPLTVPVAAGS